MSNRIARGIAVLAAGGVWACSKGNARADSMALADSASAKAAAGAVATTPPAPPLTDANIFSLLDEANAADSTMGHLASTKGTAASVKEFGRQMMRDHHTLRKDGQELAKKLNVTPSPPTNDTLPAAAQRVRDNLTAMPKGPEWDKAYITGEIGAHQGVLSMLQTAQGAATDTSLKAAITMAIPMIEAHLKKAQEIDSKLNAMPATTATESGKADSGKKP